MERKVLRILKKKNPKNSELVVLGTEDDHHNLQSSRVRLKTELKG